MAVALTREINADSSKDTREIPVAEYALLQEAFTKFNDASARLQKRYEELVSETEELRRQVEEKDKEAKRNERLRILGETAAAIAHEVRNPLGAMRLFVSLLRQDAKESCGSNEIIDGIERSISSIDHVVGNILQFSKDAPAVMTPVNLHSIISEEVSSLRSQYQSIEFVVSLRARPFLAGNEQGLRQVIRNLLSNAVDAVRRSGRISISTVDEGLDFLRLEVFDSGNGVPAQIIDRIFDPFVTGKNDGTGLGLAIVRRVIEQHQGKIEVKNIPGAEFTVVLPRSANLSSYK